MKKLIQLTALVALVTASTFANARSVQYTGVRAVLTAIHTAADFPYPAGPALSRGLISVNQIQNKIFLDLYQTTTNCPDGAACYFPTMNVNIEIPLLSYQPSRCGDTYIGQRENNGVIETITVTDYSRALCKMVFPASTVVEYYYQVSGQSQQLGRSVFYAEKLQLYMGAR